MAGSLGLRCGRRVPMLAALGMIAMLAWGCAGGGERQAASGEAGELMTQAKAMFAPLPKVMPGSGRDTPEMIALGEKLYHEAGLSVNKTQSCNTCHRLDGNLAGVDNEPTSAGAHGERGTRNSPTVYNAGFHFAQFWDGRARDLEEQAAGPILEPVEMAMPDAATVVSRLRGLGYSGAFEKAFPGQKDPVSFDNYARAIAAFERTLVSESRFDDYLRGDEKALKDEEKLGLKAFVDGGCIACHSGAIMGGTMYQKTGLLHPYPHSDDPGRFKVTNKPEDKMIFKVPSLRNAALTAPYFHDGGIATLEESVSHMAWMQLGQKLSNEDVKTITAFIGSLSGKGLKALERKPTPQG